MIANPYLIFGTIFALGLLLGLPIMWLLLRARLKAQESRQAETAQQFQDALLAKERLEAEIQRVPRLEAENQALQEVKVKLVAKVSALETSLEAEAEKQTWVSRAQENMREAFQALAAQVLTSNSEEFLKRTRESVQNFLNQMSGGWQTHKA
jgi:predicted RNase H-like nuclease (RuvC/YqgF family)